MGHAHDTAIEGEHVGDTAARGPNRHGAEHGHDGHAPAVDHTDHTDHADHDGHGEHGDHGDHGDHADHGGHADHAAMFRDRFWWTLVLSVPLVVLSEMVQMWLGYDLGDGLLVTWLPPLLGTVVVVYGGRVFFVEGWQEARARTPGMMLLIALAVGVAYFASLATTFGLLDLDFWWELGALVTIMLLGHWQEMRAVGQATDALESLSELLPDDAERITQDGDIEIVPVSTLVAGDVVLVRPGSAVPADGEVAEGEADVDESMLTGETTPVARGEGDRLAAGSVVAGSALRVRVTATGDDTALAGIRRMVAEAQQSTGRAQRLADRAAALLFYVATGTAVVTAVVWLALGEPGEAVTRAVTVLVISCPHALGLAIPLVVSISTSKSARAGMLVRDRLALERLRDVDVVLFDKTGTLTKGEHRVADVAAEDTDQALRWAAAVEADSEHPLARAIVTAAHDRGLTVPTASDFSSLAGRGVRANVEGHDVAVGGPQLLEHLDLTPPRRLVDQADPWRDRGAAVLHLVVDGEVVAAFGLEDEIRPEAAQAVADLHAAGVEVAMLTGDAQNVATAVAADLGIDRVRAQVLPEDKQDEVRTLQADGRTVAMVGDGVNDAPALALADVGIAIGAGTDVAAASAHVILASDDPRGVVSLRRLSAATYRKMRENLVWAVGYNVVAIPLAAGVLAPVGVVLPPAVGAILMSVSTIVVALNAQLLRRLDLAPGRG